MLKKIVYLPEFQLHAHITSIYQHISTLTHQHINMDYHSYQINCKPGQHDIIIAMLSDAPFDTFEEKESEVVAYLPVAADGPAVEGLVEELAQQFEFTWAKAVHPAQNWNEVWESNFQPVRVGDFCQIRAPFHPPHHATTYLMIQMMQGQPFRGRKVLDYGCGTGVLAILAAKMGAELIDAVDIEAPAYDNTIENAQLNNVHDIRAIKGTLNAVIDSDYDYILANINRHVILQSLPALYEMLSPIGRLLVSGILLADVELVETAAAEAGLIVDQRLQRDQWAAIQFSK